MNVELLYGVRIPLRDGIRLDATVYRPKTERYAAPCIVAMTPYGTDSIHEPAFYFASRGLPFVAVDVRGRGNSGGVFSPHLQEAEDGYDVVEWVAKLPCCSGKAAMWGGSYVGFCQWAAAKERPPSLATIVPMASSFRGVDVPMRSNIFSPYLLQWLNMVRGANTQKIGASDRQYWADVYRQWYSSGRPLRELDQIAGTPSSLFQEWLSHPTPDDYWDARNPTAAHYRGMQLPILTITGCYDDDQPGALEHYMQHLRHAERVFAKQHYLIIGPWDHAGIGRPTTTVGEVNVGAAGVVDLKGLQFEWYQWIMQGGEKPCFLEDRVAYYVMGEERWRYARTLDAVTSRVEALYLDSDGSAGKSFSAGFLAATPRGTPDSYTFDPDQDTPLVLEAVTRAREYSLIDPTEFLAFQGKQLVYYSEPFEGDTEISGFFRFSAWIAIDTPDTDFYVTVSELCLDGTSIRLSRDGMRARYREDLRAPKLVESISALRYDFNRFTFVSRQIKRGHRLRLVVSPVGRLIDSMFSERNFNGGGVVASEHVRSSRRVTVTLYHDAAHPSALYVPLGAGVESHDLKYLDS